MADIFLGTVVVVGLIYAVSAFLAVVYYFALKIWRAAWPRMVRSATRVRTGRPVK